jgi:hypothetical protein
MRNLIRVASLAALMAFSMPLIASEQMKAIVGSYLEIQAMLAADKVDGIKAPAEAIAKQAVAMGESGSAIAKAANAVAQAPDLAKARDAFGLLSNAVIAGAKAQGWTDLGDVKLAFCPMAPNGSWLQKEEKIRNPYYGSKMIDCGTFQERK